MITVIGASGAVGRPALARLVERGAPLRALTSSETSAAALRSAGVGQVVMGDFLNDADLHRVIKGTASLLYIPTAMRADEAEIGKRVVAAARAHGGGHIVYISCFHPQISALAHHHHKLLVEEAILEANLTYTILQPSMFMQNLGHIWRDVRENGVMRWPWDPAGLFNLVDTGDLAEAIATVLTQPGYRGATFEICGPETISVHEAAARLSKVWGRPVHADRFDPQDWAVGMRALGMSEWGVSNMLNMARHYDAHGYTGGNPLVLETIIGRPATRYQDFLHAFLAAQSGA